MRIIATTAALALGAVMLTGSPAAAAPDGCNGDPANPLCPVMDPTTAGTLYLEYMCPANRAGNRFDAQLNKRSEGWYGKRPKAKTRAAAKRLGKALTELSEGIGDGYTYAGFWPENVADDIETIAQVAFGNAGIAYRVARKSYRWDDLDWSEYGSAADNVRYALGLPPRNADDDGC